MLERIGWLIEILNIILCLHMLYGERLHSKLITVGFVGLDFLALEIINRFSLNRVNIVAVYIMIWVYILLEFEVTLWESLMTLILLVIICPLLELLATVPWVLLGGNALDIIWTPILQLEVTVFLLLLRRMLHFLLRFVKQKNKIAILIGICFAGCLVLESARYYAFGIIPVEYYLFILVFGFAVSIFAYYWQKEKEERQQKELELQLQNVCDASFRELIEAIRMKQHDFYNHIHTIEAQHYAIHTYDELVKEQEHYCQEIMQDSRFYSLLNAESPVLSGFLYGKISDADKQEIVVDYQVTLRRFSFSVPEYIIVEVIGILWDNAIEHVMVSGDKRVRIHICEYMDDEEQVMLIVVQNPVDNLSYEEITSFFRKGYTRKTGHSGIGLAKVKRYAEKYHFRLSAEKRDNNGRWLAIEIEIREKLIEKQP